MRSQLISKINNGKYLLFIDDKKKLQQFGVSISLLTNNFLLFGTLPKLYRSEIETIEFYNFLSVTKNIYLYLESKEFINKYNKYDDIIYSINFYSSTFFLKKWEEIATIKLSYIAK